MRIMRICDISYPCPLFSYQTVRNLSENENPHRFLYSTKMVSLRTMENTAPTTTQPKNNRHYIAYLCAPTSEVRGRSDPTTIPCGKWQIRASKQVLEGRRWNLQAKCPSCGNRPRLSAKNAMIFSARQHAERFVESSIRMKEFEDANPNWEAEYESGLRGEEE